TLLVDAGFIGVMFLLISYFGNLLQETALAIGNGKTTEQIQQMLISSPEQAEVFLASLKGLVFTFAAGAAAVFIGGLLLYSLSRKLIWDYLLKKKFNKRTYWKWNSLNLVLTIMAVVYLFVSGLFRLLIEYLFSIFKNQTMLDIIYNFTNLVILFAFVVFLFLVYHSFAKKYKVWGSIGEAFHLIKTKKEVKWLFLFVPVTAMILAILLWPLNGRLVGQPDTLLIINTVVSLSLLVWARGYVFRTVKDEHY
ncbi:hypothetical protein GOV03_00750, partial [Candidatus Woesearchaeota archaeon]|nr:hypothetical protein [Candidatus Woesearchaeota archaeon]